MNTITISALVQAMPEKVWQYWTLPEHITHWNHASDDWECPSAVSDLRVGGRFVVRMSAKDGSEGFDFTGEYTAVEPYTNISYTIDGGRVVDITFEETAGGVLVTETFEMEDVNSEELQRAGWQAILNNFTQYVERT